MHLVTAPFPDRFLQQALRALALVAGGLSLHLAASAAPLYRIAEVPVLPDTTPYAAALNDAGAVTGTLYPAGLNPELRRAFRWQTDSGLTLAPRSNPKLAQFANAIDRDGIVVVSVSQGSKILPTFLRTEWWLPDDRVRRDPDVFSFFGNGAGDLVIDGQSSVYALRTRQGQVLPIDAPARVELLDLNNRRQVVGRQELAGGQARAVSWSAAGGLKQIPVLPDEAQVSAVAVNDGGVVALMTGELTLQANVPSAPNSMHLWSSRRGLRPMGTVPGCTWYRPMKLSAAGVVVGYCHAQPSVLSPSHAFAWTAADGLFLLDAQVDPADPLAGRYQLNKAVSVNAGGQILVEARSADGLQRVLLLTPQGAP